MRRTGVELVDGEDPTSWRERPRCRCRRAAASPRRSDGDQAELTWTDQFCGSAMILSPCVTRSVAWTAAPPPASPRPAMHPPEVVLRRLRTPSRTPCTYRSVFPGCRRSGEVPPTAVTRGHLTALASLGVRHPYVGNREAQLRVEGGELGSQLQAALRNEAEAAPFEVRAQLEHLGQHGQRPWVAALAGRPPYWFSTSAAAFSDLREATWRSVWRMWSDSKPASPTGGKPYSAGNENGGGHWHHHRGHVSGAEKPIEAEVR